MESPGGNWRANGKYIVPSLKCWELAIYSLAHRCLLFRLLTAQHLVCYSLLNVVLYDSMFLISFTFFFIFDYFNNLRLWALYLNIYIPFYFTLKSSSTLTLSFNPTSNISILTLPTFYINCCQNHYAFQLYSRPVHSNNHVRCP